MNGQTKRLLLLVSVTGLMLASVGAVADALVLTEQERLEQLAADIVQAQPGLRVDAALRHVDTDREPVRTRLGDRRGHFGDGEGFELARAMRNALRELERPGVEFIQTAAVADRRGSATRNEDPRGHVSLRYRAQGGQPRDLTLHLRRHGDGWLIQRVQAR